MPESVKQQRPTTPDVTEKTSPAVTKGVDHLAVLQQSIGNRALGQLLSGMAPVQRLATAPQAPGEAGTLAEVEGARGGGSNLDQQTQREMESSLGQDFSDVRVHTGADADSLSRRLSARAFTTGKDIFFSNGSYDPRSAEGRETLAHELTHVAQQGGMGAPPTRAVSEPGSPDEVEASAAGEAVRQGASVGHGGQAPRATSSSPGQPLTPADESVEATEEVEGLSSQADILAAAGAADSGDATPPDTSGAGARPDATSPWARLVIPQTVTRPGDSAEAEAASVASRIAGGQKVAVSSSLQASTLARAPNAPPTVDQRVSDLEKKQKSLEKKTAALLLDSKWSHAFNEQMATYERAVLQITNAMDTAIGNFTNTQGKQAATDQMAVQIVGAVAAVLFAFGFEWAVAGGLGKLGVSAAKIKSTVELFENPSNTAVSAAVNITGAATAKGDQQAGQAPGTIANPGGQVTPAPAGAGTNAAPQPGGGQGGGGQPAGGQGAGAGEAPSTASGSPMGFLTSNLDALKTHNQNIEKAFSARAEKMNSATDEKWMEFEAAAQEKVYSGLMDTLKASATGVEELKGQAQMATIMEKHIWAGWIRQQDEMALARDRDANDVGTQTGSGPLAPDVNSPNRAPEYNLGGDVEDRLNALGVSGEAGVKLSGHWFLPNSGDWSRKLFAWAQGYGSNPEARVKK